MVQHRLNGSLNARRLFFATQLIDDPLERLRVLLKLSQ
jgi:hypothetical protein